MGDSLSLDKINKDKPGMVVAPMCSSNTRMFEGIGEAIIRLGEAGKFVVLCNATALSEEKTKAVGRSKVLGSSMYLENGYIVSLGEQEGAFVVELNLAQPYVISPTRLEGSLSVVGRPVQYSIRMVNGELELKHKGEDRELVERKIGIVNPNIFKMFDKTLCFEVFETLDFSVREEIRREMGNLGYRSYTIIGPYEMLIEYLDEDASKLHKVLKSPEIASKIKLSGVEFHVQKPIVFNKISYQRFPQIFEEPSADELEDIIRIANDWESVFGKSRENLLKKEFIFGNRDTAYLGHSKVKSFIFVFFSSPWGKWTPERFKKRVIPRIMDIFSSEIVSIFEGYGIGINSHILIEAFGNPYAIFDLLYEVHNLSKSEGLEAKTTTFVCVEELSKLIYKSLKEPALSYPYKEIRDTKIREILKPNEYDELTLKPSTRQLNIVSVFQKYYDIAIEKNREGLLKDLVALMVTTDINVCHGSFDATAAKMDAKMREFIEGKLEKAEIDAQRLREEFKIQKPISSWSPGETIDFIKKWNTKYRDDVFVWDVELENLVRINEVRKYYAHPDKWKEEENKIPTPTKIEEAIIHLFDFLGKSPIFEEWN